MSSSHFFEPPVEVEGLKKAVEEIGGVFDDHPEQGEGYPSYIAKKGVDWLFVYVQDGRVTEVIRYGRTDPTWFIEILTKKYGVEYTNL